MLSRRLVAVLALIPTLALFADPPGVYAIRGGTVHPVSGPAIENGTVVIRNGLIESVGTAPAPADAAIIDASGKHVYPGLIDAHTTFGFSVPKRSERAKDEPHADTLALRTVSISDDDLSSRWTTGVTTVVTAPAHGIFAGQPAMLNLIAGPNESRVVRSPVALKVTFDTRPTWTYPDSLMGVISYIRQTLFDAQQYTAARAVYERSPSGLRRPDENPSLDALRPFLARELPVVFVADSDLMLRRAQTIAREFNLRYVLAGAQGGYEIAGELGDTPVLVSVDWPKPPGDEQEREDQPLRVIRHRQLAPTTPAVLEGRNHLFALVSGSGKAGDFLPGIRKAIDSGLSPEAALRATTLAPARIFGAERQLGTLERGKIANIVITDQPIFEEKMKVTSIFIDGREMRLPQETEKPAESAPSPIDGTWTLNVAAPQGNVTILVTLTASEGKISGTYSGDRGSGDIRSGTFEGNSFEFTISATAQNEAEMTDWVFAGTIDGNAMSGAVTTTLGRFEFTGSKSE
jgi:hypothetical protein